MQSLLLLLSIFSSAARCQPSLPPAAAAAGHEGWHLAARQLGEQGPGWVASGISRQSYQREGEESRIYD